MSKKLNKYTADFDYVDQPLLVLSAAIDVTSIASFATAIDASLE